MTDKENDWLNMDMEEYERKLIFTRHPETDFRLEVAKSLHFICKLLAVYTGYMEDKNEN